MPSRKLRSAFVVTLSTFAPAFGCKSTDPPMTPEPPVNPPATSVPTSPPLATVSGSALSEAGAPPVATGSPHAIDWAAYSHELNPRDAEHRMIFRAPTGCVVYVPDSRPPTSWQPPKTKAVQCPAEMNDPAWEACTYGTLQAKADRSECLCSRDGNPPPPPKLMACPK